MNEWMNGFGAIHKGYFELANLIPKKDTGNDMRLWEIHFSATLCTLTRTVLRWSKSFTHYSTSSLEPVGYFNPVIPTQCNEDEDSGI